jgi:large subunit ribosomal protein L32
MALPKQKIGKTKRDKRRASCYMPIRQPALVRCPSCNGYKLSHFVCPHCGWYKGKSVVTIKVKKETA